MLVLAGDGDTFTRLCLQVDRLLPVDGYILDKLERIHAGRIVFYHVGSHLQRTVQHQIKPQLARQRGTHTAVVGGIGLAAVHLKDAGCVVHRTANHAGKGQNGGVIDRIAAKGLILGAAGTLIANPVRIGTTDACGACGLMGIHHNLVLGCLLDTIKIVVVEGLAVVVFAVGYDIAHIARLHALVPPFVHKPVGLLQMALIVDGRRGRFVMHNHVHTLLSGIVGDSLHVKVGIRGHKVKDIVFLVAKPVLPSHIPAFHQHRIKSMLGRKVDVPFHVVGIGSMSAVGLHLLVVGLAQLHAEHIVGIGPATFSLDHLPPYAHILGGAYPAGVLQFAGFVQVERDSAGQDVLSAFTHDDGTPGRYRGSLDMSLVALCVRGEMAHQLAVALLVRRVVVIGEVHGGVVDTGSLMQINVDALIGTQLQGRLHGGGSGRCLGRIGGNGLFHPPAYLTQAACLPFILLCVVVAGYPPGCVVACHLELAFFFFYDEVHEVFL